MNLEEEIEEFNTAMDNAYNFITGKVTLDTLVTDLSIGGVHTYVLPFDPEKETGTDPETLDLVIEHFESLEEYEKCQVLLKIKKKYNG
jgi:hypothetical protein|tara:strand:- start:283 stop:546 length:264 start_codon:yes stop_codon:yes gene_type:complete